MPMVVRGAMGPILAEEAVAAREDRLAWEGMVATVTQVAVVSVAAAVVGMVEVRARQMWGVFRVLVQTAETMPRPQEGERLAVRQTMVPLAVVVEGVIAETGTAV